MFFISTDSMVLIDTDSFNAFTNFVGTLSFFITLIWILRFASQME
jgi:hypothetical protein